jgi:alanyl-tRNA synthetase
MIDTSYTGLRKTFLEFFKNKGHTIVPSSPLVPGNDPTLLFTNAGMVQFKEAFLGLEKRSYQRATSSQRCVRAGGKHNDLENVGYTARHHTFFEMLGNFSFGDYFKREAIQYAWEFLTQKLGLPPEKLWVTVFEEDNDTADIWLKEMGIDPNRFSRCGAKDNFWSMGDTGPCGPCTEIFYDHGPEIAGGPPGSPEEDGDRYTEIWNLVFMQFERHADGRLDPLPKPSVDTGMGLERLAAVMQGVHDNYDTDLFQHLIRATAKLANTQDLTQKALRVIADHIRSATFLIIDGIVPSNEGRGYVLRRIIRRAIRYGSHLGLKDPFFYRLVKPLAEKMAEAYPELNTMGSHIEKILKQEEEQFSKTLDNGLKILEEAIVEIKGKIIPGTTVFRLYDTYGFPVDLTADIARERGLEIDHAGFETEMQKQRKQSQSANQFTMQQHRGLALDVTTEFTGYDQLEHQANIIAVFYDGQPAKKLESGQNGIVVLDRSSFYAESGGQIGDRGILRWQGGEFEVTDTLKDGGASLHYGRVITGTLESHVPVWACVDPARRAATRLNHSATHLLHAALRKVLGPHVLQKGSLVSPERLRFDFAHSQPVTKEELTTIERLVNQQIRENFPVETELMSTDAAMNSGAIALFGEKYGDEVRVLRMSDFSTELCGGTHAKHTGDIGLLKITSESGVAAGIRRIEAVTGEGALEWITNNEQLLSQIITQCKSAPEAISDKISQLLTQNRDLEQQLKIYKAKENSNTGRTLAQQAKNFGDINILVASLPPDTDISVLRQTLDQLKDELEQNAVILLASIKDGQAQLIAGVTKNNVSRISANDIIKQMNEKIGSKGGGRPDMAQAGGGSADKLPQALQEIQSWIEKWWARTP